MNDDERWMESAIFKAEQACRRKETDWAVTPWRGEWERWHRTIENRDTVDTDIRRILANNRIIIVRSCFPSSGMWDLWNSRSDMPSPTGRAPFGIQLLQIHMPQRPLEN